MQGLQRPCRGQLTMQGHWGTQNASRAHHWQLEFSFAGSVTIYHSHFPEDGNMHAFKGLVSIILTTR